MTEEPGLPLSHVGVSVPDVWAAIDWYVTVLGFRHVMGPRVMESTSAATAETGAILGEGFRRAYQAHVVSGNGVGLELFHFLDPPESPAEEEIVYWRRGYWHLCVTVADLPATLERVLASGGTQTSLVADFVAGRPYRLVYCRDPFGNVVELMSHPYAEVFAGWPQPGMTLDPTWLNRDGTTYTGPHGPDRSDPAA